MVKEKALLLDRDGTLIEDKNYAYKIEDFELIEGVIEGLKLIQEDYLLFIITNQSGIGRGYYTEEEFLEFNNHLLNILGRHGISIEQTYYCPHINEDNCECKKPKTKFIERIVLDYDIDISSSWMLGDHPSDIEFGINGGCNTVYLTTGHGEKHLQELKEKGINPTLRSSSFLEAIKLIASNRNNI